MLTYALPHAKAMAPYLTIEFEKDDQSFKVAENQLVASTALVLYNRVRLRCERLQTFGVSPTEWDIDDFEDIMHYGIAFSGSEARSYTGRPIWLFEEAVAAESGPRAIENVWRGCQLRCFQLLNVTNTDDVLELQQWTNEIHNWGLGKHSEEFVLDVKGVLVNQVGGLHRVSMTPTEKKEWGLQAA